MRVAHRLRPAARPTTSRWTRRTRWWRSGRASPGCSSPMIPARGLHRHRGGRHRHHEHHADVGERAHPRDRHPQVARRHPAATSGASSWSRRSCCRSSAGVLGVRGGMVACSYVVSEPDAAAGAGHPLVGRRGPGARGGHRHRLRRVPGRPRRPARPDHRAAGRIAAWPASADVGEGMVIALDTMRANKLRSALTMLGVVIGVATVMTMASIVQGIRTQIFNAVEIAGPTTFYVMRFFSQTPLNPDRLPYEVRIRPVLNEADADGHRGDARDPVRRASGCRSSSASSTQGIRTQIAERLRRRRPLHGDPGRHPAPRAIVHPRRARRRRGGRASRRRSAHRLFGQHRTRSAPRSSPGRRRCVRSSGSYQKPSNIFEPPGQENGGDRARTRPPSTTTTTTRPTACSSR